MWAAANGAFALGGEFSLALALMLLVLAVVMAWFLWFIATQCKPVQRRQMLALMALILMCLAFFTLYEQTYGSWVMFTDRMLTKDLFPSWVQPASVVVCRACVPSASSLLPRHSAPPSVPAPC